MNDKFTIALLKAIYNEVAGEIEGLSEESWLPECFVVAINAVIDEIETRGYVRNGAVHPMMRDLINNS